MTKNIDDLINDMADLLEEGGEVSQEIADKYGKLFSQMLVDRLKPREPREKGTLRMSNIGKPCSRQLWYEVNDPNGAEPLKASTKLKFLYGDVIELLVLALVEAAGHTVEGTQDTQKIAGITGHRDAVIDGVVIDVKSASSYSFEKFASGTLNKDNDAFGYLPQLQSYLTAGQDDPVVVDKNRGAFLVVDKTLGHFCLDFHPRDPEPIEELYEERKATVAAPEPPERAFTDIPEGAKGNLKLPMNCSYCSHKWTCWPGLKGYAYSRGPVFLTKVVEAPRVPEMERE